MDNKEKIIEEYKKSLENKTIEELQELEQELVKYAGELDKEAAEKVFTLKDADGNPLKPARRGTFGNLIAGFIARTEITWQQALVMKRIIDFWRSKVNDVPFPILDNTLRLLGQVKYSGIADIENVVSVNEMFENIRSEFMEFSDKLYLTADKHQELLAAMALLEKVDKNTEEDK